jgi:phytanoyl-CoA hydroxylase
MVLKVMIAGVIRVSNATDEMGCLLVYPASHHLGRIKNSKGRTSNELLKQYSIENAAVIEAKASDVVFFHYFTLHGSKPNRSASTRKTVLCQMYAGHDQIEKGNIHPNEKLVIKVWNHRISRSSAGESV